MGIDLRLKHVDDATWMEPNAIVRAGRAIDENIRYSIVGKPTMSYDSASGNTATYTYRIHIQDLSSFTNNVCGYADPNGTGKLARYLPIVDPDGLGMVAEKITSVTYEGESGADPVTGVINDTWFGNVSGRQPDPNKLSAVNWRYARVTVQFSHPFYNVLNDQVSQDHPTLPSERNRYCLAYETLANEYVQLDRGVIYWDDPNCPAYINNPDGANTPANVAAGAGLVRSVTDLVVTWYRVPAKFVAQLQPKWAAMQSCVNANPFMVELYSEVVTYAPDTLLFRPYATRPRMDGAGRLEYDVEFHFAVRSNPAPSGYAMPDGSIVGGWNFFLFPDGKYYRCSWKDGENFEEIYPSKNFEAAFDTSKDPDDLT